MPRYFFEMAYDGTNYHGWQVQPNAASVQAEMNAALLKIFRNPEIYIVGAGRTDTGVHADYFVAHFDVPEIIDDTERCIFKFNSILPSDIAVYSLQRVEDKLHSRFSAMSRTYHYRLSLKKNPMMRAYAYKPIFPLDFDLMNVAAQQLLTRSDFTSFSRLHTNQKTNLCTIDHAQWTEYQNDIWIFEIKANRFLRNMVRAIVGTLFDVGRRKITVENFAEIIDSRNRCSAGSSAAACGLSLVDIEYPPGRGFEAMARKF